MATRQEYYGYLPPSQTLDLGKLTADLSKTISGIGERRTLEKEELDKIQADNAKIIRDTELGKSQTFQTMTLNGAQSGVQFINGLNKQLKAGIINPKEYKQKMTTVMDSWGTFANTVKTYDARMTEIQKQQADVNSSGLTTDSGEFFSQMSTLKDKQVFIDDSGNMSMGKVDPNTGQLDSSSVQSFRSMAMPNNTVFDKVNLNEQVGSVVKEWAPFLAEDGINTITDVRKNGAYATKLTDLVGALTDNPRMAASILRDNTGGQYNTYWSQADYNNKMAAMIKKENDTRVFMETSPMTAEEEAEFAKTASNRLIEMRLDSTDTYQPVLTPAQIKASQDAVVRTVGIYLESKSTQDEPIKPSSGGGGGTTTPKDTSSQTVDSIRKFIINGEYDSLSEFSKDKQYTFKQGAAGKLKVFKKNTNGRGTTEIGDVDFDNAGKYFEFSNLDKWSDYVADSRKRIPGAGGTTKPASGSGSGVNWK
jgi:hypothetical protein